MPTFRKIRKRCAVCKKKSEQSLLLSMSTMGAPDLDLRPPETARSTMCFWMEQCPFCGYVSQDLRRRSRVSRAFIRDDSYQSCKGRDIESDLARRFYQAYLISREADGDEEQQFNLLLCAAWASDDACDKPAAIMFRKGALRVMDRFESLDDYNLAVRADIMRRAEMYEQVIQEYKDYRSADEMMTKIIHFQIRKCREKDSSRYTIENV